MDKENINNQIKQAFNDSPKEVQGIILGNELNDLALSLSEKYKIHTDLIVHFKDIVILLLVGIMKPEEAFSSLKEHLALDDETTTGLLQDLDQNVFQKVRLSLLGKKTSKDEIKIITLGNKDVAQKEDLREQIANTTRRMPVQTKTPLDDFTNAKKSIINGTRTQLLEQIEILEAIPSDEAVEERLNNIKEKLTSINEKMEEGRKVKDEAKEFFAELGDKIADNTPKVASYSKAPTKYNIDPYRELAED